MTSFNRNNYPLTWITPQIALGHASRFQAHIEEIKKKGIDAVPNLPGRGNFSGDFPEC